MTNKKNVYEKLKFIIVNVNPDWCTVEQSGDVQTVRQGEPLDLYCIRNDVTKSLMQSLSCWYDKLISKEIIRQKRIPKARLGIRKF